MLLDQHPHCGIKIFLILHFVSIYTAVQVGIRNFMFGQHPSWNIRILFWKNIRHFFTVIFFIYTWGWLQPGRWSIHICHTSSSKSWASNKPPPFNKSYMTDSLIKKTSFCNKRLPAISVTPKNMALIRNLAMMWP